MIPKFRAWHKKEKRKFDVFQIKFGYRTKGDHLEVDASCCYVIDELGKMFHQDDLILMQSTGLLN